MSSKRSRVCPVEQAGSLEAGYRRWLQNPVKILSPYVKEGMTVLDLGCGPGFFTVDMAQMVGKFGGVIACDLQEGMLQKLRAKIAGTELEERIVLHKCEENRIGWSDKVDFVLAFYVIHEMPSQGGLFKELASILQPGGQVLMVEPPIHVSRSAFKETIKKAQEAGFQLEKGLRIIFGQTAILKRG